MLKIRGYMSSDDPALLSPRTKTLFARESHLPNEVMKLEASLPPLHPGWCPSQSSAAISGRPPMAVNPVPWHMAADLDKEVGCSFPVPIRGLPSRSVLPVYCEEHLAVLV